MPVRIAPRIEIPTIGQFIGSLARALFDFLGKVAVRIDSLPLEEKQPLKDLVISLLTTRGEDKKSLAFWTKEDKELERLLLGGAWWVLQKDITGEVKRELLRLGREGKPDQIDAYLCAHFKAEDLSRLREKAKVWLRVAYLNERKEVILDCLEAHKAGKYTLTIPTLLPLIDGLTRQFRSAYLRPRGGKNAKRVMHVGRFAGYYRRKEHRAWSVSFEKFVRQVAYVPFEFGKGQPASLFNRHGILHGEIPDYASEANSLRVFLMLDTIAQFVRAFERRSQVRLSASPKDGAHSESHS